ncbi:hypothetical protein N657DRAFT_688540 [Parathielavia appendiculata]|uniref:Uncharacterized protein n=1 Tax=Parathielavia appendiculata TaxID=2587402 RepID=A0AAN6U413_9PEZI|nr:hypothetical protein N657DRAFT_688540 [Parathielavia appendiculata]
MRQARPGGEELEDEEEARKKHLATPRTERTRTPESLSMALTPTWRSPTRSFGPRRAVLQVPPALARNPIMFPSDSSSDAGANDSGSEPN